MSPPHSPRWAGLKDYVSQRDVRLSIQATTTTTTAEDHHAPTRSIVQSWKGWARQKIGRNSIDYVTVEEVHLVPGWVTKRPLIGTPSEPDSHPFDIDLHVSGFATSRRMPESLSRSQRAFLRIARGFASIPKPSPAIQSPDTEPQDCLELLYLPPRPDEIPDDYDIETLEAHFQESGNHEVDDTHFSPQLVQAEPIPTDMARYENLVSRLKLFWASSLPSRKIHLSVYLRSSDPQYRRHQSPLHTREILTGTDGHFTDSFRIYWKDIRSHLAANQIGPGQTHVDVNEVMVEALVVNMDRSLKPYDTPTSTIQMPMAHSSMHIISDIDDTVKITKVVEGSRTIFNQVFVKDLEDTVIPEMAEWYNKMWKGGACFHYVSNSPFELLPLLQQFMGMSKLPRGSIRLKSYAGRSLFNGLLSAPATRKRGNVIEVLDQFPEAQFLLIGDSGEQDLELYSTLAAERPDQIAGIFVRDVSSVGLEDPTALMVEPGLTTPIKPKSRGTLPLPRSSPSPMLPKRAASDPDVSRAHQGAIRIPRSDKNGSPPLSPYSFEPSPLSCVSEESSASFTSEGSSVPSSSQSLAHMRPSAEGERKRWDLQVRVNKARSVVPPHIVLRVFEDPKECTEAEHIIHRSVRPN